MYQPSIPRNAQVPRSDGFSWMRTAVPGGARGVELKSKAPCSWACAERLGFMRDGRRRFRVRTACGMR